MCHSSVLPRIGPLLLVLADSPSTPWRHLLNQSNQNSTRALGETCDKQHIWATSCELSFLPETPTNFGPTNFSINWVTQANPRPLYRFCDSDSQRCCFIWLFYFFSSSIRTVKPHGNTWSQSRSSENSLIHKICTISWIKRTFLKEKYFLLAWRKRKKFEWQETQYHEQRIPYLNIVRYRTSGQSLEHLRVDWIRRERQQTRLCKNWASIRGEERFEQKESLICTFLRW